jgi:mannosyl-oligosaccharide alpha-1,2-mannosidase
MQAFNAISFADEFDQWAWNAFKAINATTRVGSGFSEITDVNAPNGGSFSNFQDSFLFAEVMKYRYAVA